MDYHAYISFDIAPDGRSIVFSSGTGKLFLHDLHTNQVQNIPFDSDIVRFPRFSPKGDIVAFKAFSKGTSGQESEPDEIGSTLHYTFLRDRKVIPLFPPSGFLDSHPFFFRDSNKIGFTRAREYRDYRSGGNWNTPGTVTGKIWDKLDFHLVDTQSRKPIPITSAELPASGVFPIGGFQTIDRILYTDLWSREGDIYYANSQTHQMGVWHCITKDKKPASIWEASLSQDASDLALIADYDLVFNFNLYLMNISTGKLTLLLKAHQESLYNLAFSPDGTWVYYLRQSKSEKDIGITLQRINRFSKSREIVLTTEELENPIPRT